MISIAERRRLLSVLPGTWRPALSHARIEQIETLYVDRKLGKSYLSAFPVGVILRTLVDIARSERLVAGLAIGAISASALIYAAWPIFQKAGVLAIILTDREKNNVLNAHGMLWGARLLPLPGAEIGMEDGKLIMRLLEQGRSPFRSGVAYETPTAHRMRLTRRPASSRRRFRARPSSAWTASGSGPPPALGMAAAASFHRDGDGSSGGVR
jgi:hypothetical protein